MKSQVVNLQVNKENFGGEIQESYSRDDLSTVVSVVLFMESTHLKFVE